MLAGLRRPPQPAQPLTPTTSTHGMHDARTQGSRGTRVLKAAVVLGYSRQPRYSGTQGSRALGVMKFWQVLKEALHSGTLAVVLGRTW